MAEGDAARGAAVTLLNTVLAEGRMLSELSEPAALAPADRARARRLAEQVLRFLEPADRVLAQHMRKSPPLEVQNALRLAVVEIGLGGAAHGAVNGAVSLMRKGKRTQHFASLVNAILRKVTPEALAQAGVQKMPRWLRQPLVHTYGRDVVAAIEQAHSVAAPLDLSLRDGADFADLGATALPTGSLRLQAAGQVSALPGYEDGKWWVQDAAAALPARLLAVKPGETVLDLCAAPGGKTMQLAAAGAKVTSLDISAQRIKRVSENLARTKLQSEVVLADAFEWEPKQQYDAILLDAPCSATGTIRRHPELPFLKDGSEVEVLAELQAQLLDRALTWLKPGGRLVFATCSLLPAEGEAQLSAALERHPDLKAEQISLQGVPADWWDATGGLRLRPDYWADQGGMDGFYCFRLVKA